jgi:hypothetical protein
MTHSRSKTIKVTSGKVVWSLFTFITDCSIQLGYVTFDSCGKLDRADVVAVPDMAGRFGGEEKGHTPKTTRRSDKVN